jgi:U3 small nucleolar RNA-associated protein 13
MAPSQALKTTFKPSRVIQPFYSGGVGCVALDRSGRILVTAYGDEAVITDIQSGAEIARIDGVRFLLFLRHIRVRPFLTGTTVGR